MSLLKQAVSSLVGLLVLAGVVPAQGPSATEMIRLSLPRGKCLLIPQGSSVNLMREDRHAVQMITVPDEKVIHVHTVIFDRAVVRVTGLKPGMTRITLADKAGNREAMTLIVVRRKPGG
jgi:hypothetical protein